MGEEAEPSVIGKDGVGRMGELKGLKMLGFVRGNGRGEVRKIGPRMGANCLKLFPLKCVCSKACLIPDNDSHFFQKEGRKVFGRKEKILKKYLSRYYACVSVCVSL